MSSPGRLRDQQARDRLVSALDRNVLVEAGAGSGKTHVMARRMAAGVASGAYEVDGMAAVTFTRKAAAELRGRFQLALEAELAGQGSAPLDRGRQQRVRAALSSLERFFAGTIHAFCAHLLRERPVEAGVSPGFSELDEQADARLRSQSWRDYVSLQTASGRRKILDLLDARVRPADLEDAFTVVTLYDEVEFPAGNARKPDAEAAWAALQAFWTSLEQLLRSPIAPETACPMQKKARRFKGQLRIARKGPDWHGAVAEMLQTWDTTPQVVQRWWAADAAGRKRVSAEAVALHTAFRDTTVRTYLTEWRHYVYRLAIDLLIDARGFASRERRRLNVLNYGDLLHLAVRVLRDSPEVRRALQRKYRWLFVDEFQDTDPVQAEILFLLAASEPDGPRESGRRVPESRDGRNDWRRIPLRPGALFVVGDPKQSIYRFRRADIDIYNTARERLDDPPMSEVLTLTTNFRSVPPLCAWANTVFAHQFPPKADAHSPAFAALDPAPAQRHGSRPAADLSGRLRGRKPVAPAEGVFTLTVPGTCTAREVGREEAGRIARYIRAEVDAGHRAFCDFLILTRKKKDRLLPYASALEALQIPIEVSGAGAFAASPDVAQLTLLLRALSDPQDAVSLVGVLRGPWFGLSDRDLFAWRQRDRWFGLRAEDAGDGNTGRGNRVGQALEALRQYYQWTRVLPAAPALERILEDTGCLALAAASPGGVAAGDLLYAIDRVRQVVADGATLAGAAEALEEDLDAASEVESLPLEPGHTDVVRLMNLHKAKGLEAKVVFLADPCGTYEPRAEVRIIRGGVRARGYFKVMCRWDEGRWKPLAEPQGWEKYEAEEKHYLAAEQKRLLYVAATRAREMLVVGRWAKGDATAHAWGPLEPFLMGAPELTVPARIAPPEPLKVDLSRRARDAADAARTAAHARARTPSWSIASVTADARRIARMTHVSGPMDESSGAGGGEHIPGGDPTSVVVRDTPSHRADAGAAWGALIHGLLEHAMRHRAVTRDYLQRLSMWLTVEEPDLRKVIDEAIDTVLAVAGQAFWREAHAGEHHVETPFAFKDAGGMVMTGVADLMFRRHHGWQVIDYKTDVADDPALAAAYAAQLTAYRRALEACGLTNVNTGLVHVRLPTTGPED